jgi:flagellar biosynthesis GTPase FlhF
MIIRKFGAASIDTAFSQIRAELGPQAVILKTRIENSSPHNAHPRIEITAAVDADLKSSPDRHAAFSIRPPDSLSQEDATGGIPIPVSNGCWLPLKTPFPGTIEVIGW